MRTEQRTGDPVDELCEAAGTSGPPALGSRGLGGLHGFLVGSVGLAVVGHAGCPVALVRAGERAADEHLADPAGIPSATTPSRPVVLGLDITAPDASLPDFAFGAAALRGAPLRVVYAWVPLPPPPYGIPDYTFEAETPPGGRRGARTAERLHAGQGAGALADVVPGRRRRRGGRGGQRRVRPGGRLPRRLPRRGRPQGAHVPARHAGRARGSGMSHTPYCTTPPPPSPSSRTPERSGERRPDDVPPAVPHGTGRTGSIQGADRAGRRRSPHQGQSSPGGGGGTRWTSPRGRFRAYASDRGSVRDGYGVSSGVRPPPLRRSRRRRPGGAPRPTPSPSGTRSWGR
ncbi:universal stress protein [Streptomyces sp. NPDC058459]|uniref:universal stress protein n=1 Tax=Streptomyces sp. NPDC058459 TaxID=3346508 RepID=UPI00364623FC